MDRTAAVVAVARSMDWLLRTITYFVVTEGEPVFLYGRIMGFELYT